MGRFIGINPKSVSMKHIYLLGLCLFFLNSCSKNSGTAEPENPSSNLKACFTVSTETPSVGDVLKIVSCSEGATSYLYDFGNGETSLKENPEIILQEGGDYTILLTIMDNDENTDSFSKDIVVTEPIEVNYIFPVIDNGFTAFPLENGINPSNGAIYSIELLEDNVGTGGSKFYYNELDENYQGTLTYIADKPFNSNSAFVNFYPSGNKNFVFTRTLDGLYGTQEVTYNGAWGFVNGINSATKHSYGYLPEGANFLYFGTEDDGGVYKTAIETRNASGDAFQVNLNNFGPADSMIGDMIKVSGGYIAFGAVFTKNAGAPHISNYKPLLVFFDSSLNVSSHTIFDSSVLDTKIDSSNDLNGSYHLEQLSNGNLVMYANGELIVSDASGSKISSTYFEGTENNQALLSLGDSFIISSDNYLRKFSLDGSEQKALKYNGNYLPEILEVSNTLFFIAGYNTTDPIDGGGNLATVKTFYGAVDANLEPVNLNQ